MSSKKMGKSGNDMNNRNRHATISNENEIFEHKSEYEYEEVTNEENQDDQIEREFKEEHEALSREFKVDSDDKNSSVKRNKERKKTLEEKWIENVEGRNRKSTTTFAEELKEKVEKELNVIKSGHYFLKYNLWPGLKKIGRGIGGLIATPLIAVAGAFTGIPPTEINYLTSGLNTAEGYLGAWKRFTTLSKQYSKEWTTMNFISRIGEIGKRILAIPTNIFIGGVTSVFNSLIANVLGGVGTIASGFQLFQKNVEKSTVFKTASRIIPVDTLMGLVGNVGKLTETLATLSNSSNLWGHIASTIAKWDIVKRFVNEDTLKLWELSGNPLVQAVYKGDKQKLLAEIKRTGGDLAQRFGATRQDLERIERLAQGDLTAINEVVRSYIPHYERITNAESFVQFTKQIKNAFTNAINENNFQNIYKGKFEEININMKSFLGLPDSASQGFKKAFGNKAGDKAKAALNTSFKTIKTSGDSMVEIAEQFLKNIGNKDKQLQKVMGYTLDAGNIKEAIATLTEQLKNKNLNEAQAFLDKIHTLKVNDEVTKKLTIVSESNLAHFKNEVLKNIDKTKKAGPYL